MLRALALNITTEDSTINEPAFLLQNMSDTAILWANEGEWGYQMKMVSDYVLFQYLIHHSELRDTLGTEAVLKHNNLRIAYTRLTTIEPLEQYYTSIKKMATNRNLDMEFRLLEYALSALASYKKKEDIPLIKQALLEYTPYLTQESFYLIKYFPDSTYIEVLENYYPRSFHRQIVNDRSTDIAYAYIAALQAYNNPKCKAILKSIFKEKCFGKFYNSVGNALQKQIDWLQNPKVDEYGFIKE